MSAARSILSLSARPRQTNCANSRIALSPLTSTAYDQKEVNNHEICLALTRTSVHFDSNLDFLCVVVGRPEPSALEADKYTNRWNWPEIMDEFSDVSSYMSATSTKVSLRVVLADSSQRPSFSNGYSEALNES